MKPSPRLSALAVLALVVLDAGAAERKDELHLDASNRGAWRTRFGTYGYQPRRAIFLEASGLRLRLPGVAGIPQTGLYSFFALSGDCQAILTYELLDVPPPRGGYGSGVGLAFDIEGEAGRGAIQRVLRTAEGSGCVLQTAVDEASGARKEVDRFVPATSRRGRIGLRRLKNELIFLRADAPSDPLYEIDRLPFTARTIRTVRLFVDSGGSATTVEIRLNRLDIEAEEIALGIPQRERSAWSWRWLGAIVVAGGAVLFWGRRIRRQRRLP